ncbi:hypothetical protein SNK03_002983 [Fusarium graminearum]
MELHGISTIDDELRFVSVFARISFEHRFKTHDLHAILSKISTINDFFLSIPFYETRFTFFFFCLDVLTKHDFLYVKISLHLPRCCSPGVILTSTEQRHNGRHFVFCLF